ncbi:MAG: 3-deoxy-D-manno-octulosonic acid transferase [Prevotellaceae bacterium]|jgi:3-deoxy-D-manno-octulosonic-acid transferase|nr:3-deoxy-D-manno-octulosonic acid transferase [Prevotellaceae bacterium]
MKIVYQVGIYIYGLFIFLASSFNTKAKKRWLGQRQVFNYLSKNADKSVEYIWIHASSLGEFEQGRPIIENLKKSNPESKILLTFFSPSGYEVRKNYTGADLICYLPLDTKNNVRRFFNSVKIQKAIFIKYEFWINFLLACKKHNIPTFIVSAIFHKDQAFFKWYGKAYANVLHVFKTIFVQNEESKQLLQSIGINTAQVCGDTRFDRVIEIAEQRKPLPIVEAFKNGKKLIIAGSSWAKDEDLLIEYQQKYPDIKLLIAPHEIHESHLQEIESKLKKGFVRYSKADENTVSAADCLIIDNFGLLSSIYQYADIAYIGGGFGTGIHNVLEAAVYGVPVVWGPNYQRFAEARGLIAYGGGFSISNYTELENIFNSVDKLAGQKASDFVQRHKGATEMILKEISH